MPDSDSKLPSTLSSASRMLASYWRCRTCGKTATSLNPDKSEAAPEHVSHRGQDIGSCPGTMGVVSKEEWEKLQLKVTIMNKQARAEEILREKLDLWPCTFLGEAGLFLMFRYEVNDNILVCELDADESSKALEQLFVLNEGELLDFCAEARTLLLGK